MIIQTLRPTNLDEFIGKKQLKNNLEIFIKSAKTRNDCLDHILLYGLAGTGKTTLATIIANEFNKKIKIIQGTQLKKASDLINYISMVSEGDFIFIDEIHAASIECIETLYSVLEDFTIDIKIGVDNNQKITRVKIPQFTAIAATTNINKIPKPLEERFGISFYFDSYSEDEIFEILKRTSKILEINMEDNDIYLIANNSKGIPRLANNYLKRIFDFKMAMPNMSISDILKELGIYDDGLVQIDVNYLKALSSNDDGLGIKSIAAFLGIDISIIENKIEPFLIKSNYVKKSSKGRILTQKGWDYIDRINKNCSAN